MVRPILRKPETQVGDEPLNVEREEPGSDNEDEEKNDVLRAHAVRLGQLSGPSSPRAPPA